MSVHLRKPSEEKAFCGTAWLAISQRIYRLLDMRRMADPPVLRPEVGQVIIRKPAAIPPSLSVRSPQLKLGLTISVVLRH